MLQAVGPSRSSKCSSIELSAHTGKLETSAVGRAAVAESEPFRPGGRFGGCRNVPKKSHPGSVDHSHKDHASRNYDSA